VFAGLGLAGVLMVALAMAQMPRFVAGGDRSTAALAGPTEPLAACTPTDDRRAGPTNMTGPAGAPASDVISRTGKPVPPATRG
jgi:hypothetical protein